VLLPGSAKAKPRWPRTYSNIKDSSGSESQAYQPLVGENIAGENIAAVSPALAGDSVEAQGFSPAKPASIQKGFSPGEEYSHADQRAGFCLDLRRDGVAFSRDGIDVHPDQSGGRRNQP
jgi:hypothetical protein